MNEEKNKNVSKTNISSKYYCIFAALLSVAILFIVMSFSQVFINSKYTFIKTDLFTQIATFSKLFWDKIKECSNIYYSFKAGLGMNTSLLFAFYVLSPFNILYIFASPQNIDSISVIVFILKIATASFSFQLYASYNLRRKDVFSIIFAVFYSLSSFGLATVHMFVLFDGVLYLPIVLILIKYSVDNKKMALLSVVYTIIFISNFYVGYVVGLASFGYFCMYIYWYKYRISRLSKVIVSYFISVSVAVLLSAFILCPAAYEAINQNAIEKFDGFNAITIWNLISYMFPFRSYQLYEVAPFFYCGIPVIILSIVFFASKEVLLKKKVLIGLIIVFAALTLFIKPLYSFVHMFNNPTGYTARHIYVLSFVLTSVGVISLDYFSKINYKVVIYTLAFLFLVHALAPSLNNQLGINDNSPSVIYYLITIIIIACWLLLFVINTGKWNNVIKIKLQSNEIIALMFLLMSIELICNGLTLFSEQKGITREDFEYRTRQASELVESLKGMDESIYRTHYNASINPNMSGVYNYYGSTLFASSGNNVLKDMLFNIGLSSTTFTIYDYGDTDLVRILMDEKYILEPWKERDNIGDNKIVANETAGFGFLVDNNLLSFDISDNVFENQNEVYSLLLGEEIKPFTLFDGEITFGGENISLSSTPDGRISAELNTGAYDGYMTIEIPHIDGCRAYGWASQGINDNVKESVIISSPSSNLVNGYGKRYLSAPQVIELTQVEDKDLFYIIFGPDTQKSIVLDKLFLAYYDDSYVGELCSKLRENELDINYFEDGLVKGTVYSNKDSLLFISIPYEEGWTAKVNGSETEIVPLLNGAFIGVPVQVGGNAIELAFEAPYSKLGIKLSIAGLICLFVIICIDYFGKIKEKNKSIKAK